MKLVHANGSRTWRILASRDEAEIANRQSPIANCQLPMANISAAFTLVEIIISIGILGMVMVAIYASWTSILRGKKAGEVAAVEAQRSRIAVSAIEAALVGIQMFDANIGHYSFETDTTGDFAMMSFVSRLPASFPGSGLFGDQVLRRVTFSVEVTNSEKQLVMRQMPMLQPLMKGEEAYPLVLARNVNLFTMEFWDARRNEWTDQWLFTNQLPKRVRVALAHGGSKDGHSSKAPEIVIRDVALTSIKVPREWQFTGGVGVPGQNPNARTNLNPNPNYQPNPNAQPNRGLNQNPIVQPPPGGRTRPGGRP